MVCHSATEAGSKLAAVVGHPDTMTPKEVADMDERRAQGAVCRVSPFWAEDGMEQPPPSADGSTSRPSAFGMRLV